MKFYFSNSKNPLIVILTSLACEIIGLTQRVVQSQFHIYKLYRPVRVLMSFEAWAKLAQKWLVCVPLRIHLEPMLMLLVTI